MFLGQVSVCLLFTRGDAVHCPRKEGDVWGQLNLTDNCSYLCSFALEELFDLIKDWRLECNVSCKFDMI